jgi:CheY-like chemotaxis protein
MSLPNTQKIKIDKTRMIESNWYRARLVGHVEKDNNNVISSHIEFELLEKDQHIWSILAHEESSLPKIQRLKQALGMADEETDLTPHYNKHVMIYVDNILKDGVILHEIKDFMIPKDIELMLDQQAEPEARNTRPKMPQPEPINKEYTADTQPISTKTRASAKIPRHILIVDDQPEVALLIGNYVEQIGFIPDIVITVDDAIDRFDPDKYLMVISDVIMPGKNGFDLVRALHNEHPNVSVALISGYFDKEMENLQKLFGIEKVYRKPVFFKSVKEMVATALKKLPLE